MGSKTARNCWALGSDTDNPMTPLPVKEACPRLQVQVCDNDLWDVYWVIWGYYTPIMENQMEKNMNNEMETLGTFLGCMRIYNPKNGASHGE